MEYWSIGKNGTSITPSLQYSNKDEALGTFALSLDTIISENEIILDTS